MIVAGHQPNYLPWTGFFHKMANCDVFVIEDCVQFEKQGFQNRNRIRTFQGVKWLTVPIRHVGKPLPINQTKIANDARPDWTKEHWLALKYNYSRAPFWKEFCNFFQNTYNQKWTKLIDLNMHLIRGLMNFLEIRTPLVMASSLGVSGKKSELILAQCKALNGKTLLSGKGGRSYLPVERFREEGIGVLFQDFQHPVYPQLNSDFVPNLSVVDFLFWTGGKSLVKRGLP